MNIEPSVSSFNERIPGKYTVAHVESEWECEVEAGGLWDAAKAGAAEAQQFWAWESTWPLMFLITRPDGKTFEVEVERECVPEFLPMYCTER